MLCGTDEENAGRRAEWGVSLNDGRVPGHLLTGQP